LGHNASTPAQIFGGKVAMLEPENLGPRFETIRLLAELERDELNYRRKREMQIFSGSAAILLAVMGAVFLPHEKDRTFIIAHGQSAQTAAIIAIVVIVVFSVAWQDREWREANEHQQALTQIFTILECFTPGKFGLSGTLFLESRKEWGKKHSSLPKRVFTFGKILATIALGFLAIISILSV
jgi:hypothetical protein